MLVGLAAGAGGVLLGWFVGHHVGYLKGLVVGRLAATIEVLDRIGKK